MNKALKNNCHSEPFDRHAEQSEASQTEILRSAQDDMRVKLSDFDYALPKELIAQDALAKRSDARLLVLNREEETIEHKAFRDILDYFEQGDVLVLNDTKVLPARILAKRRTGGKVEILVFGIGSAAGRHPEQSEGSQILRRPTGLLRMTPVPTRTGTEVEVLIKPSSRIRQGEELIIATDDTELVLRVLDGPDHKTGIRHVQFETNDDIETILEKVGRIPLPPYIDREDAPVDRELYQTVFARCPGAIASPTAGLHFDQELLQKIKTKGVEVLFVTLHVSYGTFQPVVSEDLAQHQMHEEYFEIPEETAERINLAKTEGRRIVACGTTVVRTLESAVGAPLQSIKGKTRLFIYPPYEFKMADRMITNFHLPKTTLLMLTSAFAGHEFLKKAYQEAIQNRYRFYSYGDAMLIV